MWSFFYDVFEYRDRMRERENEAINELERYNSSQSSFQIGTNRTNLSGKPLIGCWFPLNQNLQWFNQVLYSSGAPQNAQSVSFRSTPDASSHSPLSSVVSNHRRAGQAHVRTSRREETKNYTTLGNSCTVNPVKLQFTETGLNNFSDPVPANSRPVCGVNQTSAMKGCQEPSSYLRTPNPVPYLQTCRHHQQPHQCRLREPAPSLSNHNQLPAGGCADMNLQRMDILRGGSCGMGSQQAHSNGSQKIGSSYQKASEMMKTTPKDENVGKRKQASDSGIKMGIRIGNSGPLSKFPRTHNEILAPDSLPQGCSALTNEDTHGSIGTLGSSETSELMHDSADGIDRFHDDHAKPSVSLAFADDNTRAIPCKTSGQHNADWNVDVCHVTEGYSFTEFCCLSSSKSKLLCCHFSSDGRLLASAGNDKKVVVWNINRIDFRSSVKEHCLSVTDVRFRPNSCFLATSSFDKTVKVWDATALSFPQCQLVGHMAGVMSLDFHPEKGEYLCSCDSNSEIHLWNVHQQECKRISKDGAAQIRFQLQEGWLLAAASEIAINIIDFETDQLMLSLQGLAKEVVGSICWEWSGRYLATVSEDCVRIRCVASGKCTHELISLGNKFHSCTFHPVYSPVLVIGGDQAIELWDLSAGKRVRYPAHEGLIAALSSSLTGLVASASHDHSVYGNEVFLSSSSSGFRRNDSVFFFFLPLKDD